MAYDDVTTNSMQMNLGLTPGWTPPQPMFVPPAVAAQQMQAQASQQLAAAAAMTRLPAATPLAAFSQQFQQQMQSVQAQQFANPYMAQMMAGGMGAPGYQGGMLPSPLMMTPPTTGVFRPPPQLSMSAIPPQQVAPLMPTPFTPQLPNPMFQTAWDRELQQRDFRADRIYATVMQGPRAIGTAAGIGAGAWAGAQVGGAFGPMGRLVGAVGGGVLAGISGAAGGLGDAMSYPMRPSLEAHGMGGALQRMTQQFVLTGPQLHEQGAGLSRVASIGLGEQIRNLSANRGFRAETGNMFNREDLMRITELSGRAGLMDMEQGTEAIRNNLRQVSRVVRRFMELTGDPDVTSVIREMGQLRAFGMSINEMERAAQNMKTFARAAGVSVRGLQEMGGMPAAYTYQQMGLGAATGMEMGNYAFAAARQAVASGTFSPRELSMLGGVQGVAQRNVQAQAALTSMPLFGAAVAGYGPQGWNVNYNQLAQVSRGGQGGMGAAGMVLGAVQNIGQAVTQGGVGALAEFPLRQKFIQDQAAASMHPAQQMAMRFQMAQQTGQLLGFQGGQAFTVGARAMYGDDVATQMMMEARNPQAFREQAAMLRRQNEDIARAQRAQIMESRPGFWDVMGAKAGIQPGHGFFTGRGSIGEALSEMGTSISHSSLFHYFEDVDARKRGERINRVSALAGIENEQQRSNISKKIKRGLLTSDSFKRIQKSVAAGPGEIKMAEANDVLALVNPEMASAMATGETAASIGGGVLSVAGLLTSWIPPVGAALEAGGVALSVMGSEGMMSTIAMSGKEKLFLDQSRAEANRRNYLSTASRQVTTAGLTSAATSMAKTMGGGSDMETKINLGMSLAGSELAKTARGKVGIITDSYLSSKDVSNSMTQGLMRAGLTAEQANKAIAGLSKEQFQQFAGVTLRNGKEEGGNYASGIFEKFHEQAQAFGGLTGEKLEQSLAERAKHYEELANWGGESDVGAQELRGKARSFSKTEYLAMAYAGASYGGKDEYGSNRKAILDVFKKAGASTADIQRYLEQGRSLYKTLKSDEARMALAEQVAGQTAGEMVGWVETKQYEAGVGTVKSGAQRLGKSLGIQGLGSETGDLEAIVGELSSQENLAKLSKGAGTKDIAGLVTKWKSATGSDRKRLMDQIAATIGDRYGKFGPGDTFESLRGAEGEQAAQNTAAADALEGLAAQLEGAGFGEFKQGAADFVEGAKLLRQAMDSETMRQALAAAAQQGG